MKNTGTGNKRDRKLQKEESNTGITTHTRVETGMTTTVGMRDGVERRALHCGKRIVKHFQGRKTLL